VANLRKIRRRTKEIILFYAKKKQIRENRLQGPDKRTGKKERLYIKNNGDVTASTVHKSMPR
jgi:hypothetical protein